MHEHSSPFEDSEFVSLFSKLRRPVASAVADTLIELASIENGHSLLDLGCGPGLIAKEVMKKRALYHALLVDSSDEMTEKARRNILGMRTTVDVREANLDFGSLETLREPDLLYDHVIAMDLWHLLKNRKRLAKFIAQRLLGSEGNFTLAIHREISENKMKEWHEFRRDIRDDISISLRKIYPRFVFEQRSRGATVHKDEISTYLSETSRCGLKLLKSRTDRSLADINQMVHHLPESFAIEVKRNLPEISGERLKRVVSRALSEALRRHRNILHSPIAEEVFYVFVKP